MVADGHTVISKPFSTLSCPYYLHFSSCTALSFVLLKSGSEQAGNDVQWAQEMMPEFEKRARTDIDIREMVSEVKSRADFGIEG